MLPARYDDDDDDDIYIYIVIHRLTLSLHHNSTVRLDTQEA